MHQRVNYWKLAVLVVLSLVGLAAVGAGGYGALRGYQAHTYLTTPVGTVDGKPLTRAGYLELQLAREAAAQKPAEGAK
jgi:hypothetical protein